MAKERKEEKDKKERKEKKGKVNSEDKKTKRSSKVEKKSKRKEESHVSKTVLKLVAEEKAIDPALDALFASSVCAYWILPQYRR